MKPVSQSLSESLKIVCRNGGVPDFKQLRFFSPPGGRIHSTYIAVSRSRAFVLQQINTAVIDDPWALIRATQLGFRHANIDNAVMSWPSVRDPVLVLNREHWIRRTFFEGEPPANPVSNLDLQSMSKAVNQLHNSISVREFKACEFNSVNPWTDVAACSLAQRLSLSWKNFTSEEHTTIRRLQSAMDHITADDNSRSLYRKNVHPDQARPLPVETVVHRDTKPANFIKRPDGTMLLIDFDTLGTGDPAQDLGELIRAALTEREDETEISKEWPQNADIATIIRSICAGYGDLSMTGTRIQLAALYSCLWQCQRYLDDHLAGDFYYKVSYRGENLLNAKRQLDAIELLSDVRID